MPNNIANTLATGDRIKITYANVVHIADVEGRDYIKGTRKTFYSVTVRDVDGNRFKFSQDSCYLKAGDLITIKGTIKKFDNVFKFVRLNRVKIIERHSTMDKGLQL